MLTLLVPIAVTIGFAELPCDAVVFARQTKEIHISTQIRCAREKKFWSMYYGTLIKALSNNTVSTEEIKQIPVVPVDFEVALGKSAYNHLARVKNPAPESVTRLRELSQVYLFRDKQFVKSSLIGTWMKADGQLTERTTYLTAASFYLRKDPKAALEWLEDFNPEDKKLFVVANLLRARSYLALGQFDMARDHYLETPAQDPLWLDAMIELSWAYIHRRDFSGAIGQVSLLGKMSQVVAPASSAQQTIGYLSLCQYPSAYRTLTNFEQNYSEWRKSLEAISTDANFYSNMIAHLNDQTNSGRIYRNLARQRDFINWQNTINDIIDEEGAIKNAGKSFMKLLDDKSNDLKQTRAELAKTQARLKRKRFGAGEKRLLETAETELLKKESEQAQDMRDLQTVRQTIKVQYEGIQKSRMARLLSVQSQLTLKLQHQAKHLASDLTRLFDLNEIFRFEIFAGSGENVRAFAVGGAKGRLPASARPTVKSLSWVFNGEIWLDEAGHVKSLTENRCTQ